MLNSRVDEQNWVRCGKCGHKLMRKTSGGSCADEHDEECATSHAFEIKCHSCKEINLVKR